MARKEIELAYRAYEWHSKTGKPAPWPKFDKKKINQKLIPHEERPKEFDAFIEDGVGHLEWITQECKRPSDQFHEEIIRAFKENGLEPGSIIHVKYCERGASRMKKYDLTIQ